MVDEGVSSVFAVPGSGASFTLLSALIDAGASCYTVQHEASAALMAGALCNDGVTRGASVSIKGPGLANMVAGIVSNYFESRPALSISESYSETASADLVHKRFDHTEMLQQFVKAHLAPDTDALQAAFREARQERPGPIHVDLGYTQKATVEHLPLVCEGEADVFLNKISRSKRPLMIVGSMSNRRGLKAVLDVVNIPFCTTASGKGVMDETSSFFAGIVTGEMGEFSPENLVLQHADLIIGVGLRNYELTRVRDMGVPLICMDVTNGNWFHGLNVEYTLIREELNLLCGDIFRILANKTWGQELIERRNTAIEALIDESRWNGLVAMQTLQEQAPLETTLVLDTGFHCTIGETIWKSGGAQGFLGSSVGRYMGTSIPTAIGYSIGFDTPVICVFGDGGVSPFFADVNLAVRQQLNVLFVMFSDKKLGSVSAFVDPDRNYLLDTRETWVERFQSMGVSSYSADSPEELMARVIEWKSAGKPLFIECLFEAEEYSRQARKLR